MCRELGRETEGTVVPGIASGFGGGIGNTGSVCGAVVGAVMALGMERAEGGSREAAMQTASVVQEFRRRFEGEMGTIHCRELTGADLSTEEGIAAYMESDTPATVCFPAVATAYRLVLDLLGETL